MEKELEYLGTALENPQRPFVAVLGGAKISGKIDVIEQLLPKVDRLIIGGAMACTFFKAMGLETGKSLVEADRVEHGEEHSSNAAGGKLLLPHDAIVSTAIDASAERAHRRARRDPGRRGDVRHRAAIGRSVRALRSPRRRRVLWNGPMGVFETPPFDAGTRAIAEAMAAATEAGRDDDRRRRRFGGGGRRAGARGAR